MADAPQFTLAGIRASAPFPWRSQVNFNMAGGCRMIDSKNTEVPLMTIMAFAGIMSATIEAQTQPAQATP